jgi:hypothetical protein
MPFDFYYMVKDFPKLTNYPHHLRWMQISFEKTELSGTILVAVFSKPHSRPSLKRLFKPDSYAWVQRFFYSIKNSYI